MFARPFCVAHTLVSGRVVVLLLIFFTMEPVSLSVYIQEKVRLGASKQIIMEQLTAVGWSEDEVHEAYAQALLSMGVPSPRKGEKDVYGKRSGAIEVVVNLFSFILLGVITSGLLILYFDIIEYFFPDALTRANGYYYTSSTSSSTHYAIAALCIGFPLLVFALRMWFRRFREEESVSESGITKWVTYIVLLVASVTIVADLITVLYTFLQGELSPRFFLKGLVVLSVAGGIFGFYFLERKKIQFRKDVSRKTFQFFGWGLFVVIAIGVVLGFSVAGSPKEERMRQFDVRRSENLSQLAYCIQDYAQQFEVLPESLDALEKTNQFSYCGEMRDPETNVSYGYTIRTPLEGEGAVRKGSFELCANFSLASNESKSTSLDMIKNKWYNHEAGTVCFEEIISVKSVSPAP